MNKPRLEAFSDGVFAIVMTLLIFEVKIPAIAGSVTNAQIWALLAQLSPLIASYALSFLVLAVFWINHNFLFHTFVKKIDRNLNLLNLVYLLFLVFVPFSALLFGTYPYNEPAALVYGLNIFAVMIVFATMVRYVVFHKDLRNELPSRLIKQARVRSLLSEVCYLIGIIFTFIFIPVSIFFYIFPLIFNIIPGTLNLAEKLFKFELA